MSPNMTVAPASARAVANPRPDSGYSKALFYSSLIHTPTDAARASGKESSLSLYAGHIIRFAEVDWGGEVRFLLGWVQDVSHLQLLLLPLTFGTVTQDQERSLLQRRYSRRLILMSRPRTEP